MKRDMDRYVSLYEIDYKIMSGKQLIKYNKQLLLTNHGLRVQLMGNYRNMVPEQVIEQRFIKQIHGLQDELQDANYKLALIETESK